MREDGQEVASAMPPDAVRWLRRFAWVAVLGPVVFVVALPYLAMLVMEPHFPRRGMLLSAILGGAVVVAFGLLMVTLVAHAYREVVGLQERALSAERHSAVLVERGRIAREMHDSLAQVLAVTHLRLRLLESDPAVAGAPAVHDEVHELADLCQESVRDVRETILGLRSDARQDSCLADSLAELLAAFSRSTGISTGLAVDPPDVDLPPEQRVQASRVVQEALANARKHSGAAHVQVTLARTADRTRLVVSDDGRGFDPAAAPPEGHYGLATMAERITQVGGRLDVISAPGEGTSVVAELPHRPWPSPTRQESR